MPIFKHSDGVVTQVWRDVHTLEEFNNKYSGISDVEEGDAVVGQHWDGTNLTDPLPDPTVTKEMVNAESKRRIHELIGAASDQEGNEKLANLQIEYMAILDALFDGGTLTDEETQRRAIIKGGNDRIKQIRAFSNDLTAMETIPLDYADDKYWT